MSEQSELKALGKRIRELRGKQSRSQFAENFLVAPSSLARWEAGESQPELGFLIRVASAYGFSLEWLITGEGEFPENGRIQADKQFRYLDDIDWAKAKKERQGSSTPSAPEKNQEKAGAALADMSNDYIACLRQLVDVQKENGDLRVEAEKLRARNAELERQLAEALKLSKPSPLDGKVASVG